MKATIYIHLYGGCLDDVKLFANEQDALEFFENLKGCKYEDYRDTDKNYDEHFIYPNVEFETKTS